MSGYYPLSEYDFKFTKFYLVGVSSAEKLESLAKLPPEGLPAEGPQWPKNGNVDEYTSAVRFLAGGAIP